MKHENRVMVHKGTICWTEDGLRFTTKKSYYVDSVVEDSEYSFFTLSYKGITFVAASEGVTEPCDRCRQTGIYTWGGTVNGVPRFSNTCYRCGGKGYWNYADRKRNWGYDRFGCNWKVNA